MLKECGLGYDVKIASSPDLAVQLLEKEKFDLVISDLMMPKKNGIELLHEIKRRWDTPVIIYTAYSEAIHPSVMMREGADAVMTKPAQLEVFLNTIRAILDPAHATTVVLIHGYKALEIKNQVLAQMIQKVLNKTEGNITAAAEMMDVSRECFGIMMRRLNITK